MESVTSTVTTMNTHMGQRSVTNPTADRKMRSDAQQSLRWTAMASPRSRPRKRASGGRSSMARHRARPLASPTAQITRNTGTMYRKISIDSQSATSKIMQRT